MATRRKVFTGTVASEFQSAFHRIGTLRSQLAVQEAKFNDFTDRASEDEIVRPNEVKQAMEAVADIRQEVHCIGISLQALVVACNYVYKQNL